MQLRAFCSACLTMKPTVFVMSGNGTPHCVRLITLSLPLHPLRRNLDYCFQPRSLSVKQTGWSFKCVEIPSDATASHCLLKETGKEETEKKCVEGCIILTWRMDLWLFLWSCCAVPQQWHGNCVFRPIVSVTRLKTCICKAPVVVDAHLGLHIQLVSNAM